MTESSTAGSHWGDEQEPPPKKRGLPKWLWWCGGGCLVLLLVVGVLGVWGISKVKQMQSPENQWAALREAQPFDQPPPGWEPVVYIPMGRTRIHTLSAPGGTMAILMHMRGPDAKQGRAQLLDEKFEGSFLGFGGRKDVTKSTLALGGRELTVLRFYQGKGEGQAGGREGYSAMVDVTPPERAEDELLVWQFVRPGASLSDEELSALLEPWDVGGGR